MSEIVDLLSEYQAIDDKDSLYARVLKSVIVDREIKLRRELERQIEASTRDRGYLARMRHFTRYAPLELLAEMYGPLRHPAP
jgi:hypothetical protein